MGQVYFRLALLEELTPLLLATCTFHLMRIMNTYHILGSGTKFVTDWISLMNTYIAFTNSSIVITLTPFDLNVWTYKMWCAEQQWKCYELAIIMKVSKCATSSVTYLALSIGNSTFSLIHLVILEFT